MLLEACEKGDLSAVEHLIGREDLESKTPQGFTPLIIAAKQGHTQIVECLVKNGANINSINHARQSSLFMACWNNQIETVQKLVALKANLNQPDHRGWTPLIISVYQNNEEITSILLNAGCDIEKKDCFGKQAIDRAKTLKMIDLIKAALAKQRKNRIKSPLRSPARSARGSSPNSTPKSEKMTSTVPNQFREVRSSTPVSGSLNRSSSEKSISVDFRKLLREKIDKKTRVKVNEINDKIYEKWGLALGRHLQDALREADSEISRSWKTLAEVRGKEVLAKMKDFAFKSVEILRQSKVNRPRTGDKALVAGGIDELMAESISKFQYKFTNEIEKSLEGLVDKQIKGFIGQARNEVLAGVQNYLNECFGKNTGLAESELTARSDKSEKSEKMQRFEKPDFGKAGFESKGKGVRGKESKNMPHMNIASTLQEFLKFEQMSKS